MFSTEIAIIVLSYVSVIFKGKSGLGMAPLFPG